MYFRKLLKLSSMLLICVLGFSGTAGAANTWNCSCGSKNNTGKYCGECGSRRPGTEPAKSSGSEAKPSPQPSTNDMRPSPNIFMVDGPGMMNSNVWKHERLNGSWIAPEGDVAAEISGFDYKLGIYKAGEADNFAWLKYRFYFPGPLDSPPGRDRIPVNLSSPTIIKDSQGNELATLKEMWEEKGTLFVKLDYAFDGIIRVRQLRRPRTILE